MKIAKPAEAGKTFAYGDINYLLLSEIIETKMGKPFHRAVSELLDFKKLNLINTWFVDLGKKAKTNNAFCASVFQQIQLGFISIQSFLGLVQWWWFGFYYKRCSAFFFNIYLRAK